MVTPALRALRRRFPAAELIAQGRPHLEALLAGGDLFDRFLSSRDVTPAEVAALGADAAIVFPHSFRAAFEVYRAGIPIRVGYRREGRGVLFTQSIDPHLRNVPARRADRWRRRAFRALQRISKGAARRWIERDPAILKVNRESESVIPIPMVEQYLELVAVVGAEGDTAGPSLPVSAEVDAAAREHRRSLGIADDERYFAVNPGASFGVSKVYPTDLLVDALERIASQLDQRVLVLCGPGEESLAAEVAGRLGPTAVSSHEKLIPLDRVKAILRDASLLITTDTGPWHIGNAFHVPSVVLMGPTDPRYTNSRWSRSVVLRREVPCGPCHQKRCPFEHHRCMREITPETVAAEALRLLESH